MDLALHALRRENLANRIFVARDGVEALDFRVCCGDVSAAHGSIIRQSWYCWI